MSERGGPVGRLGRWLWAENLALPLLGLVMALVEGIAIRAVYLAAFGGHRRIAESLDLPLGHAVLWVGGGAVAALGCAASYRLLRYGRMWVAAPVVVAVCFPLLVIGSGSVYASLVVSAIL